MTGRIVPLTEELVLWAALEEGNPTTMNLAQIKGWAAQFCAFGTMGGALLDNGIVCAAGGLVPFWHGRAMAWFMVSPRATRTHRMAALKQIRGCLIAAQRHPEFRRVELYARADRALSGERLAGFLGMDFEGTMRGFDPLGRAYHLFARVAEKEDD